MSDVTDIRAYLEGKGLRLKRASADEVNTTCFFCQEDPQARGRLYINVNPNADIPGLFECKLCDTHGALPTIMRHFGDQPEKGDGEAEDDRSLLKREILAEAAVYYHAQLTEHPTAYHWLRSPERGLTLETIMERKLGYADGTLYRHLRDAGYKVADMRATGLITQNSEGRNVDALIGMVTIPYFVAGNVVMIRGRAYPYDGNGLKYKTPPGQKQRLYDTDKLWGFGDGDDVIIAEGEFDCMVIHQLGFENVIALPGAGQWQDVWDGYVSHLRRIYTVFDNDPAGNKGLAKMLEKFGKKVHQVELATGADKMDPTKWVAQGHTADDFAELLASFKGSGLLITVDEAIAEHDRVQSMPGLKFNYATLDGVISPGLQGPQLCVLLAKSGTGKTIWLLNTFQRMAMYAGQEDLRFLFVSLEQTAGEWWERARRIFRFYNLDGGGDRAAANWWRERLVIVDKNRLSEDDLRTVIDEHTERYGKPGGIGLDYLGYFARSFKGEEYQRLSDAVMACKGITKDLEIPMLCPHQVSRGSGHGEEPKLDDARGSGVIEETADFVFTLWTEDNRHGADPDSKTGIIQMRIAKSRHGGRNTLLKYQFAPLSLALVPANDPENVALAKAELRYEQIKDPWEVAQMRHAGVLPSGTRADANDYRRYLDGRQDGFAS